MTSAATLGQAAIFQIYLEDLRVKIGSDNEVPRIVLTDISSDLIVTILGSTINKSSDFDAQSFIWCIVKKDWEDSFVKLQSSLPPTISLREFDSLTHARNSSSIDKPAILLMPATSGERESLKDLPYVNIDSLLNESADFPWLEILTDTFQSVHQIDSFEENKAVFLKESKRLEKILKAALGRQDPLARWCTAIEIAMSVLKDTPNMTIKQALGKSIVAFRLFADSTLLDEENDDRAKLKVNKNAEEARQVRTGESGERKIKPDTPQAEVVQIFGVFEDPADQFDPSIEINWLNDRLERPARRTSLGLGEQIATRLQNKDADAALELLTPELIEALNDGNVAGAEFVLTQKVLRENLNKGLITKLEKILNPQANSDVGNFPIELHLSLSRILRSADPSVLAPIEINIDDSSWKEVLPSRAVLEAFRFLHLPSLLEISGSSRLRIGFNINSLEKKIEELTAQIDKAELEKSEPAELEDEDLDKSIEFVDAITFSVTNGFQTEQFSWSCVEWDAQTIREEIERVQLGSQNLRTHGLVSLADLYSDFFLNFLTLGIPKQEKIIEFTNSWSSMIRESREVLSRNKQACRDVLELHTRASETETGKVILFTHPERLRWLRGYLDSITEDTIDLLNREFETNPGNFDRYLLWMQDRTPIGIPPFTNSDSIARCLLPTQEGPLNSVYESLFIKSAHDSLLPNRFINRISQSIIDYLNIHPHKRDGLSIAIFESSSSTPVSAAITEQVLKNRQELRLTCDVFCDSNWNEKILNDFTSNTIIANHISRNISQDLISPPFALRLVEGSITNLQNLDSEKIYDVLLVIDFFSQTPKATKKLTEASTSFDFNPLFHNSSHWKLLDTKPAEFVKVLLPHNSSAVLQEWSTLEVWATDLAANDADVSLVEYLQIQTKFSNQVSAYKSLHASSVWVISIDKVLGREQFEIIPDPPEVLQIVQDLGVNASHTMIISSSENSKVIKRIERNIRSKAPDWTLVAGNLARSAYETARKLSPRQILSAGGESSTYLEVIGLAASYHFLSQPEGTNDAWEIWLSFDDLTDWFESGNHSKRPDLLRLLATKNDLGQLNLDFIIIECKQRESFYGESLNKAIAQAVKGRTFIQSAFQDEKKNDIQMWRSEFASILPDGLVSETGETVGAINRIGKPSFSLRDVASGIQGSNFIATVDACVVRAGFAVSSLSDEIIDGVRVIQLPLDSVLNKLNSHGS